MDIFAIRDEVVDGYREFTTSFVDPHDERIRDFVADQMDKGHVDPKTIITNEIPLSSLPDMMDTLRGPNNETKVHVTMGA